MERHIWTTIFLLFSFTTLLFGGYNCAQRTIYPDPNVGIDLTTHFPPVAPPVDPIATDSTTDNTDDDVDNRLPQEPQGGCSRSQYRELEKTYGASAFIHLDKNQLREFLLGRDANFALGCPRLFLNMQKYGRRFEGSLAIVYEGQRAGGGREIKVEKHETGSSEADTQYNDWKGSWNKTRRRVVEARFSAIFSRIPIRAVVVHINKVEKHDIGDGEVSYLGSGDIWFKSFRAYSGNRGDTCYRQGAFTSVASIQAVAPRNISCWNLSTGPFSCLPDGINTLAKVASRLKPNVRKLDLPCYRKFGEFGRLDISKAFNLSSDEKINSL